MGFYGIEIVLLALLCSATHGVLDEQKLHLKFLEKNGNSAEVSQHKVLFS